MEPVKYISLSVQELVANKDAERDIVIINSEISDLKSIFLNVYKLSLKEFTPFNPHA